MTNAEIIALQKRNRELRVSAESIAIRLRAADATPSLLTEAADVIDFLHEQIARMNREALDEQRETNRALGDAYAEGRHEGLTKSRDGW